MKNPITDYETFRETRDSDMQFCLNYCELKKFWESIFPKCNENIIVRENGIEVFHVFRDEKDFNKVISTGLKPRNQLVKEGYLKTGDLGSIDENARALYRNDVTYFNYPINETQKEGLENKCWISVLVDPDKTMVHNAELRAVKQEDYFSSMIKLKDYISRIKKLDAKRLESPKAPLIPNPFTAEPTWAWINSEKNSDKDPQTHLYDVGYNLNEVVIPRIINPSEFYRTSKTKELEAE